MLFAGLILLALAFVAVIVFRNHEKLYAWPIWAVTALAFSWLILAGVVVLALVEAADTYRWSREVLGRTRRDAIRHATWKVGL